MTSRRTGTRPSSAQVVLASTAGPLAGPVACVGAFASVVVLLQSHRIQPNPAVPMVVVSALLVLLRRRATRASLFAPLVVAAFLTVPDPGLSAFLRLVAGFAMAVGLLPVMLASLRTGSARRGSPAGASQRRSPWVVAAGTSPLVGEIARQTYTGLELVPDPGVLHSPWEGAVAPLYAVAATVTLLLSLPDARALRRARHAPRAAATDDLGGTTPEATWRRDVASLAWSLAIDAATLTAAWTCFGYRSRV